MPEELGIDQEPKLGRMAVGTDGSELEGLARASPFGPMIEAKAVEEDPQASPFNSAKWQSEEFPVLALLFSEESLEESNSESFISREVPSRVCWPWNISAGCVPTGDSGLSSFEPSSRQCTDWLCRNSSW